MTALRLESVTVRYGSTTALSGLALHVESGEVLGVLGPSGSGKTTLLNAVAGFVDVADGEIWINSSLVADARRSVPTERRGVGVVFQSYGLWPHMTVLDTVAYPMRRAGRARHEARVRAGELLARVGLEGKEHRRPQMLSGGEQQRVGLARALAREPRLFLFDEPTANLDSGLRAGLQEQIREQQQRAGAAALYVTHDPAEAFAVADRIAVIRSAELVQVATPREIYAAPSDAWVARLTGPVSIVRGEVLDATTVRIDGAVIHGVEVRGADLGGVRADGAREVDLAMRPEWVRTGAAGELPLAATVRSVAFSGGHTIYTLVATCGTVTVHVPGTAEPAQRGDDLSWAPTAASILASNRETPVGADLL